MLKLLFIFIFLTLLPIDSQWVVNFATILPRFKYCNVTIKSWLDQSYPPDFILIYVTSNWDFKRKRRSQIPSVKNGNDILVKTRKDN